tara:strand:- start:210 stop:1067 length:858 start_codon:yes stop_codon:yes gene_type:complete
MRSNNQIILLLSLCAVIVTIIVATCAASAIVKKSYRLGNEIDLWFTGNTRARSYLLFDSKVEGLVCYLRDNPPNTERMTVDYYGSSVFLSYSYDLLKDHLVSYRRVLKNAIVKYFGTTERFYTANQCVVHYRTGDFLANKEYGSSMVTPKQVVDQVIHLKPQSVLLLDGGLKHKGAELITHTLDIDKATSLKKEIRERLNDKNIPFTESTQSADHDFVTMACADYLVTGLGSYAITAAIANEHGQIRTPALKVLNPNEMKKGEKQDIPPAEIIKNWTTYCASESC